MKTLLKRCSAWCALLHALLVPAWAYAQELPPDNDSREWYWQWGTMVGIAGIIGLICFKNPKRSHDN